jgi:hypothetical protein
MLRISAIICFVFFFSSCSNNSEKDLASYRYLKQGLEKSIKAITYENALIYTEFESKRSDPRLSEKVVIWGPKIETTRKLSDTLTKYIRYLKIDLGNLAETENDKTAVEKIFGKSKIDELLEKILTYRKNMLGQDEEMNKVFASRISSLTNDFDTVRQNFETKYFEDKPAIAVSVILNMLENDVRIMENDFIHFCNYKTLIIIEDFEVFRTLISQSSNYVKAGDNIVIEAGVGAYSRRPNSKITIMGKEVDCKEQGFASYKFKTPLKAGKYIVPVKIEYIDVDGIKKAMTYKVEYTVVE